MFEIKQRKVERTKIKNECPVQNVTIRKGQKERSTAFCKDLSNVYLKNVRNQRFNQSYHDTRSWYHGTAVSLECVQAPPLPSGLLGACLQAILTS